MNEDISKEIKESYPKPEEVVTKDVAEKEEKIAKGVGEMPVIGDELEKRKQKVISFLKNSQTWVIAILIVALILGVYIRSIPMHAHGATPGLWDITTNTWTLGPDLDPWLFTRYAKTIVEQGSLPHMDYFRNVPLGFDTTGETLLLPYMITWVYYFFHAFDATTNVEFAAVIFPVIMFGFTIISFFLFVREIFTRKSRKSIIKANMIALISTFFMIVTPSFLSRTIAGIPEKESAGFFFMFLAFYLFLKAWKSEKIKKACIFSFFAGFSTTCMALIWGGYMYIFIPIGGASLIAFIFNKVNKKEYIIYSIWVITSFLLMTFFSHRFNLEGLMVSLSTGVAFLTFIIMSVHFLLWNSRLSKINNSLRKINLPKNIISIIVAFVLILILSVLFFGPSFITDKIKTIHQLVFKPIQGRWNTTVAENRQPDFKEWSQSFGPFFKNIPLFFWLFFIGAVALFKKMFNKIRKTDAWILTFFYVFLLLGMIFSRYSSSSIFNGENFISKLFYYASVLLFIGFSIKYYLDYFKKGECEQFKNINYEYILVTALLLLTLFAARGAIRLVMVLAVIAPIFVGFLIVETAVKFQKTKEETLKLVLGVCGIIILIASMFTFISYYNTVKIQAYNFVPSHYTQQWQKAMQWVRDETPTDAVFSHWWDYGYWVQSIGNRATSVDGGNAITYWNYLMGRLVLTGDNQDDALEFLYNHNTTHFLIDSTDIGKYGAYSSIGSNENYDRYSWFGTFLIDESKTQETKNQTILFYNGGVALDEDLIINENGKEILLPAMKSGIGAIIIPLQTQNNQNNFEQPYMIGVYNNNQYKINLRYLSINNEIIDFGNGTEACAYVIPSLKTSNGAVSQNPLGAIILISERQLRGLFSQIYLLNDPFDNFPNFKIAHVQTNLIIENMRSQGMDVPEIIYYQGIQGPIKIWEIEYTGKEEIKQEYIDKVASKYLDWQL